MVMKYLGKIEKVKFGHVGYQESIAAHMATQSYLQGRKIVWDPVMEKIV